MAKRSRPRFNSRLVLTSVGTLLLAILVVQSLAIWHLYARTDQLKTGELKAVLIDAARSLNTEPAVDPGSGRRFFPAYRLVLPAKLESRVFYRDGGDASTVWLGGLSNQGQAATGVQTAESLPDIFKQVDTLQKCSRQVVVTLDGADTNSPDKPALKTTKKLADGRTAYIYENDCPFGAEPLLRSAEQLQSF